MQIIKDKTELKDFHESLHYDTDGGNFSFIGGETLIYIDYAHGSERFEEVWYLEVYRLKDDVLARVDEVGQAYLNDKLEWVETMIFNNQLDAFYHYTGLIIKGGQQSLL